LVVNAIQRAFESTLAAILTYDAEQDEFVSLAIAGEPGSYPAPPYRQHASKGVVERAARLRKTQVANDTRRDPDYFSLENQNALSEMVVPLVHNGYLPVSQGIAVYPTEANEIYRLIDIAYQRLYIAKERGRNQIEPDESHWHYIKHPA